MTKKIIVTGGSGFIGSHLIFQLLKRKYKVLNIDKLSFVSQKLKIADRNYSFKKINLNNLNKLKSIFKSFKPNYVINCAAESHVDRSIVDPFYFFSNNLESTINVLECIKYTDINLLHVSTDEVFGSLSSGEKKFSENTKYDPKSPYSASKAASDHAVRSYGSTYKINYKITNCSNNYGPYQYPEKLIPVVVKSCMNKQSIPIYGKGKNIRDWIYVEDHCKGIIRVMEKGKNRNTYLIGANKELSNIDLVKRICKLFDKINNSKDSHKLIKFVKDRKGHDFRYALNSSKIVKELRWYPETKLEEGLEKTVKFYYTNFKNLKKIFPY